MKYFSEKLNKAFDTEEECLTAEAAFDKEQEEKKKQEELAVVTKKNLAKDIETQQPIGRGHRAQLGSAGLLPPTGLAGSHPQRHPLQVARAGLGRGQPQRHDLHDHHTRYLLLLHAQEPLDARLCPAGLA